jgi:hypothetical protein
MLFLRFGSPFPLASFPLQLEVYILLGMVVPFGTIVIGHRSGLFLVADMSQCYNATFLPEMIAGGIPCLVSSPMKTVLTEGQDHET